MVFAYSKDVQTHLVGVLDLFDEVAHPIRRADGKAGLVERRCEAIDADLHLWPSPSPRLRRGCHGREGGHLEGGGPVMVDPYVITYML